MRQQSRNALSLTAILAGLACLLAFPARAQVEPSTPTRRLITAAVDGRNFVTLAGNTRPEVNASNDRGPADNSLLLEHMQLTLQLPAEKQQELDQLVQDLQNPASPNYHKWLTADEFRRQFSPAPEDVVTISRWLEAQGFTINVTYPKSIDFSGTVGQVGAAFRTEIHNLEVNGVGHFANMSDPQIPAALAPAVAGIVSLNDFRPHPAHTPRADYTVSGGEYLLVPGDLATVYNFNPLFSNGVSGQGQTVVVVEDSDVYSTSDWSTFRSTLGLSGYTGGSFTQIHPAPPTGTTNCADPGANGDDDEADIDVQWASAAAPSAAIVLASCSDTSNFGGFIALQNLLNESTTPPAIISISYGESEAQLGASSNSYINSLYEQAVAEGVSVFVSAGDEGAASSDGGDSYASHGITVSGFATTIYNLAAGGTDFSDIYSGTSSTYWNSSNTSTYESAKSYIPEIPWNDSCASQLISGYLGYSTTYGSSGFCNSTIGKNSYLTVTAGSGGPSACATGVPSTSGTVSGTCAGWAKPSWQSVFGNPADGVRDIPDASLFAANGVWGHYYVVCYADTSRGGHKCTGAPSTWSGFGGTSFVAPILAGVQALINQVTGSSAGNPAPTYYSLAAPEYGSSGNSSCNSSLGNEAASTCVFYDVTQGDMDVNCRGTANCYLPSGTNGALSQSSSAYEPAFGTSAGWDFATGLGTINIANLVNNWPKPPSFTSAASTTFVVGIQGTFTVTATGTPAPTLAESGTLPSSVTFNSATGVLSGTPAAGTGGVYDVTFTASNGVEPNATQNFTLTVNQAPAITSAASTTFTAGSAGTFTVTATGYPAPALGESGTLPTGVTFNTSTGVLSGTPSSSGTFNISFTASNSVGSNAVQSFTLNVITSSGVGTFSNGYTYQRALTINASEVSGGTQTNFPVLIAGTYPYLATVAHGGNVTSANGYDIIFTSDAAGNNLLNWELESYNATTGAVDIWVRIPTLSSTANTVIYVWYGNSSVSTFQGGAQGSVWDSNFKGVYHLPNGSVLSASDSTSGANNGVLVGPPSAVSGEIDGAASFNGSTDYINLGTSVNVVSPITVEAWIENGTAAVSKNVISKGYDGTNTEWALMSLVGSPTKLSFITYNNGTGVTGVTSNSNLSTSSWQHWVGIYNGTTWMLYLNGVLDASATASGPISTAQKIEIGAVDDDGSPLQFWDGSIDEVRLSNVARSANWIATEYNNQSSPANFYSISGVETAGGTSVPSITSISPTAGTIGTVITITGAAFGSTQGASTVTFNGTTATPTSWSASSITVPVPSGATTGAVIVTVGTASNGINFTVTPGGATYSYQRALTINAGEVSGGPQTNFPVLISGTYSYLATVSNGGNVTNANGYDIIFTSDAAGNNLLNWELESYNATTGAVDIWVRIPTLSSTANTVIYVWYGNSSVSTFQGGAQGSVWDSNFKGVYHLPNGSVLSASDSTSGANNGVLVGPPSAVSGEIDGAASFNGSTDYINLGTSVNVVSPITVEAWIENGTAAVSKNVISKGYDGTNTEWALMSLVGSPTKLSFITYNNGTGVTGVTSNSNLSTSSWQHWVGIYNGTTWMLYLNGVLDASATASGPISTAQKIEIGAVDDDGSPLQFWDGSIDEVRLSNVARSANWIATEYNNQSSPANFYSISGVETAGGTSVPSITSISPTAGTIGTVITITGAAFGSTQGASTVTFNGTTATPTSWSASSITVPVPSGATTGAVIVTVGTASNGINFTVTPGGATYSYQRALTINAGEVSGGPQTNFPVLISGTYSYLATVSNGGNVTNANGYDIIFTSDAAGNNLLNWELESYNATTGAVDIWVRIPTLSSTANTVIYVWYGNSSVSTFQGGAQGSVWDSNFKGVYHLPNGSVLSASDSTSGANNGVLVGPPSAVSGEIDGAASFNGSTDYINLGTSVNVVSPITVEAWIENGTAAVSKNVISKGYDGTNTEWALMSLVGSPTKLSFITYNNGTGVTGVTSNSNLSTSSWQHWVGIYNGTTWMLYLNGVLDASATASGPISTAQKIEIGAVDDDGSPLQFWDGSIDEVRLSNVARSANWIATEYNNQSSPANFYSIGAVQ